MDKRQDAKTPSRQEPEAELDVLARRVIGAAITVHRTLGPGFPESVYENALCLELNAQGISYAQQHVINVFYRNQQVGQGQIDILVENKLVLELKTVEQIHPKHKAQAKAYLVATGCQLALLINFHEAILKEGITRIVWNPNA